MHEYGPAADTWIGGRGAEANKLVREESNSSSVISP